MNNLQPSENDKQLRKLLGNWRIDATLPPRFQEGVWSRIDAGHPASPVIRATVWKLLVTRFTRPAFVTAYLAVLLMVGMGAGYQHGQSKSAQTNSALQNRYLQMVDPYKTPR